MSFPLLLDHFIPRNFILKTLQQCLSPLFKKFHHKAVLVITTVLLRDRLLSGDAEMHRRRCRPSGEIYIKINYNRGC